MPVTAPVQPAGCVRREPDTVILHTAIPYIVILHTPILHTPIPTAETVSCSTSCFKNRRRAAALRRATSCVSAD